MGADILQRIAKIVLESTTMTFIYMYRDLLITKEKMKEISIGKGQKDHETPVVDITASKWQNHYMGNYKEIIPYIWVI